jgi:hypothetical protein
MAKTNDQKQGWNEEVVIINGWHTSQNLKGRDHLGDLEVDSRILRWVSKYI